MQVFKSFFAIIRRNMGLMVMYAGIFMVLSVTLSRVGVTDAKDSFVASRVPLTVVDRDDSEFSRGLTEFLYARHTAVPLADEAQNLRDALYQRETEYILYIPAGYEAALLAGSAPAMETAKVAGSYTSAYVDGHIQSFVGTAKAYLAAGLPVGQALAGAESDLALETGINLSQEETQPLPAVFYYFKYLSYALLMILIFGLAPVLLVYNRRELAARVNSSALPLRRKNMELALAGVLLALVVFAVFIVVAFIMYRGEMLNMGALLCVANAFVFLLFSVALAMLIGQLSKNSNMVSALANVVVMALCFFGGVYVPVQYLGDTMQKLARFLPTYWYIQAVETATTAVNLTGEALSSIGLNMAMQLAFAVAMLSVALVVSRQKHKAV